MDQIYHTGAFDMRPRPETSAYNRTQNWENSSPKLRWMKREKKCDTQECVQLIDWLLQKTFVFSFFHRLDNSLFNFLAL